MSNTPFRTTQLSLAIYLHASRALEFLKVERIGPNRFEFLFRDDDEQGPRHEMEMESGKPVSAAAIFASQKYLRQVLTKAQNTPNITGVSNDRTNYSHTTR
jgi:hypothetical protein